MASERLRRGDLRGDANAWRWLLTAKEKFSKQQPLIADQSCGISITQVMGTSVLIYEQMCAAEKRKRRKRDTLPMPATSVVINELVCEGCGDCSVESNCLSVEPVETPFGRKRRINHSTCNTDHIGDLQAADGFRLTYQVALRANAGSGTLERTRPGSACHGTITASRG